VRIELPGAAHDGPGTPEALPPDALAPGPDA